MAALRAAKLDDVIEHSAGRAHTADTDVNLTLEQIGRIAGVSRSTVSRVLNDHPGVRAEVRARVEAVIDETGYFPNQAARALASNRTGVIGLVVPADVDELFGDPYYSALVRGIYEGSIEHGSIFSIFPIYGTDASATALSSLLGQRLVDGVIVTAGHRSDDLIKGLRGRVERLVVIGHPSDARGIVRVDVENRAGSAVAVTHLRELGRRRIGFVGPTPEYRFGVERLDGYRDALRVAGTAVEERLIRFEQPTPDGGYRATIALLAEHPDAIHVATDTMAEGALRALRDRRMAIPDDVAIVGFDGLPAAPPTEPALTTVVQPVVEVGRTAVGLLVGAPGSSQTVVLPTRLRVAQSCGAPTS